MLLVASVVAGMYGAAHNQISYTISPGFFEEELFPRFHIPLDLRNRVGATFVGFLGTWWIGVVTGLPVIIAGQLTRRVVEARSRIILAFTVILMTAFVVGLMGLGWAASTLTSSNIRPDRIAIMHAGTMHNFGYAGGMLGMILGLIVVCWRPRQRGESVSPTTD
ncbi:MAG: hypothetical protein SH850_14465 [Planctomycetaceae bacterium]|nr:hypothetical protein [Planctomycetaceae bacterium]